MKISDYAVKNYQFTLIIFLMVVALGVTTILTMPRSEDPDINAPQFPVVVVYPGTSPGDMEEIVVDPLEKKLYALEDIKRIKTFISDGLAVLTVEYKYSSDVEEKYQELVREVNTIRTQLPKEIAAMEVRKIQPSDVNVIQLALISENAGMLTLKKEAERLQEKLEKVTALKNVEIFGIPEQQVKVDLNLSKMAQLHIPLDAVLNVLQSEIANIPGGSVQEGARSFNVKTSGNYKDEQEVANTIIYSVNRKNILLKDIANVYKDFETTTHITRLNGHRAVFVTAAQKKQENISTTQQAYLPVIEAFRKTLPSNIDLKLHFDQADNVNKRLNGLAFDFLIAILLVAITLLPLGMRAASVVMISIPLSLAIGIVLLNLMGYTLNQLSIVGLVVALGLLVDDSIVVVENIERWLREGHSRLEATLKATQQIGLAVIGCTATLIISFLPIIFLPEASGDFIRSLPMAVISAVIASMLVSLTIIPFLSSRVLKEHSGHPDGNVFMRALKRVIHGSYSRLLEKALQRPVMTVLIGLLVFGGSLALFPVVGFSLFPASEKPQFMVNVISPLQSNIEYTDSITRTVERELKKVPEVQYVATNVGHGNPRVYYNIVPKDDRSDFAELFVQLEEHTSPKRKLAIIDQLRKQWTPYPGAKVEVKNFEQGPPVIAPVEVRLYGENLDTLSVLAAQVEKLLRTVDGTLYVNNPLMHRKSDIKVAINKEKAIQLGVPTLSMDRSIRMAVAGLEMGTFTDAAGDEFSIVVSKPKEARPGLEVFDDLYVNAANGTAIPLKQIAGLTFESSPLSINHFNKARTVSVSAYVQKGYLNDEVINGVIAKMDQVKLPSGYSYEMGGEVESRNESFGGFGTIILVTIFLFIAVLILEFRTFKSTLIVLSVIPLGIVGAVLALLVTGNSLSFVATIGIIALAGIEVKNTILLVDFTNQLREKGMPLEQAIREAGEIRFLPIVLTSLTAIGGLFPIAISTNPLISPLAIVMIGGLISSTILSRVVTPVVYKLIPPAVELQK
ncbi:MAG: efflux RND transporter permease subunit [Bacteroidetes bacterium]|nr:efflux RND transporter permease subunit [Bacteroidota bacterium]